MSETPRTDSQLLTVKDCSYVAPHPTGEYVHADFARRLEREIAALREDKERLDWLQTREEPQTYEEAPHSLMWYVLAEEGERDLRAAIDAARGREAKT